MLLAMSRDILTSYGYEVLAAATPEEALRIARERNGRIDLLVADVVMPRMNGMELAKRISELRPETKCLFVSGYTDDVIATHGMLTDELEFLAKPFLPNELNKKIASILGRA